MNNCITLKKKEYEALLAKAASKDPVRIDVRINNGISVNGYDRGYEKCFSNTFEETTVSIDLSDPLLYQIERIKDHVIRDAKIMTERARDKLIEDLNIKIKRITEQEYELKQQFLSYCREGRRGRKKFIEKWGA